MREGERWVERLVVGVGGHVEQQKIKKEVDFECVALCI